ncbi:MAG: aa3-type cytochrome c oxidase subunit IV [Caulobacteraceae bacterium]|nr:aa3-type cytochrome c oxidase subunit IV [Caulobacteraceae bacterium]
MADSKHEYHRGEMDISEQEATYSLFMGLSKWGSLLIAASLVLLTIWFCTPMGFFTGAFGFVVVMVLGWFLLRSKPQAH